MARKLHAAADRSAVLCDRVEAAIARAAFEVILPDSEPTSLATLAIDRTLQIERYCQNSEPLPAPEFNTSA